MLGKMEFVSLGQRAVDRGDSNKVGHQDQGHFRVREMHEPKQRSRYENCDGQTMASFDWPLHVATECRLFDDACHGRTREEKTE